MSYVRFGSDGSDVYVYMDVGGYLACCSCSLAAYDDKGAVIDQKAWEFWSTQAMIDHLAAHRAAGHTVPAIEDELRADSAENFPLGRDVSDGGHHG